MKKFKLLGTGKTSLHLPGFLQGTGRGWGRSPQFSLFHLEVGIVKDIPLLGSTLGSEMNLLSYRERVMSCATEKPNQQTATGVLLAGVCIVTVRMKKVMCLIRKEPSEATSFDAIYFIRTQYWGNR